MGAGEENPEVCSCVPQGVKYSQAWIVSLSLGLFTFNHFEINRLLANAMSSILMLYEK